MTGDDGAPEIRPPGSRALPARDQLASVLAPMLALADVDGLTLVLASVELWTSSVFLRTAILRNATTDELDAEHEAAFEQWSETARETPPPPQPATRLMRLELTLSDDVGTGYRNQGRSAAGAGTEWRAEWKFQPGAPPGATRLTLTLRGRDGEQTHELAL
jgi:hypothetical protein